MINKKYQLPRDLSVDESKHHKFSELAEEDIFKTMKSVFLYAMAIGFYKKLKIPLKKKKNSIPSSSISEPDEKWTKERWLLNAIALTETEDINIILDGEKVAHIAEEYANYGIDILYDVFKNPHKNYPKSYQILDSLLDSLLEDL